MGRFYTAKTHFRQSGRDDKKPNIVMLMTDAGTKITMLTAGQKRREAAG